jgi:hypothetical protein
MAWHILWLDMLHQADKGHCRIYSAACVGYSFVIYTLWHRFERLRLRLRKPAKLRINIHISM